MELRELEGGDIVWILKVNPVGMLILKWNLGNSMEVVLRGFLQHNTLG
jgi:hypothetical protein